MTMMGEGELAYNIEIALHILGHITDDVFRAIYDSCDGYGNKEIASFLAEKVMEFRGNEEYDGQYGSTANDVYWFVVYNRDKWIEKLYDEGVQDWG